MIDTIMDSCLEIQHPTVKKLIDQESRNNLFTSSCIFHLSPFRGGSPLSKAIPIDTPILDSETHNRLTIDWCLEINIRI